MNGTRNQQLLQSNQIGIRCWKCGHGEFRVIYTRHTRDGTITRRRECLKCGTRISTRESVIGA